MQQQNAAIKCTNEMQQQASNAKKSNLIQKQQKIIEELLDRLEGLSQLWRENLLLQETLKPYYLNNWTKLININEDRA